MDSYKVLYACCTNTALKILRRSFFRWIAALSIFLSVYTYSETLRAEGSAFKMRDKNHPDTSDKVKRSKTEASIKKSLITSKATRGGAKELKLSEWLALVRRNNPSLRLSRAHLKKFDADIFSAKWSWLPRGEVSATVAPTPKYRCRVPQEFLPSTWTEAEKQSWMDEKVDGITNRNRYCVTTDKDVNLDDYSIDGVYTRLQVKLGLPLSAFWKRGFALTAARSQKRAGRYKADEITLSMEKTARKAYWGVKMAREMLYTLNEGRPVLNKAIKRVKKELESDEGDASLGDKFRLLILKSQVESWKLDAKEVESVALAGLNALAGEAGMKGSGKSLKYDVDRAPLTEAKEKLLSLQMYLDKAWQNHPQLKMMREAIKGRKAMVKLRKSEFFPDLILVGRYLHVHSNSDDPASAYAYDRLHGNSAYIGLTLKWDLDFRSKYVNLAKAKADVLIAREGRRARHTKTEHKITKAYEKASTAQKKVKLAAKAHSHAKSWLTAVSQSHDMGIARAKEVADALKAYFQTKMEYAKTVYGMRLARAELAAAVGITGSKIHE